jgi:hypothetical protein
MNDVRPPNAPWRALNPVEAAGGYLSYYYSDDISPLPVRWVTKPRDNKSDPNLETCTYGLFSTCSPNMRSGLVQNKATHIFFFTRRNSERQLAGYYRVGWYAIGPQGPRDYCLAADKSHFVQFPISLRSIDARLSTNFSRWFRGLRRTTEKETKQLVVLLDEQPDVRQKYLDEIDRLERFNLKHGGFRYIGWRRSVPFSWDEAIRYLSAPATIATSVPNSSPTDKWQCSHCGHVVQNKALLKQCPACDRLGTLRPSVS